MRMLQELILLHTFSALAISANLRHHTAPQAQEIAKVAPNSQHYFLYENCQAQDTGQSPANVLTNFSEIIIINHKLRISLSRNNHNQLNHKLRISLSLESSDCCRPWHQTGGPAALQTLWEVVL